eukprot:1200875-Pleurochrysis_carterae.AAC.1
MKTQSGQEKGRARTRARLRSTEGSEGVREPSELSMRCIHARLDAHARHLGTKESRIGSERGEKSRDKGRAQGRGEPVGV